MSWPLFVGISQQGSRRHELPFGRLASLHPGGQAPVPLVDLPHPGRPDNENLDCQQQANSLSGSDSVLANSLSYGRCCNDATSAETLPGQNHHALQSATIPHRPFSNRLHHRPPNGPPGPPKVLKHRAITTFGLVPSLTAHFRRDLRPSPYT